MKDSVHRSRTATPHRRRFHAFPMVGLIIALSAAAGLADQLCYNHVTSSSQPPNWGQPPLIDGSIVNGDPRCFAGTTPPCSGPDLGWANSFGYVFNNADGPYPLPDVIIEGIRDDKYLYLSVQANNSTPTVTGTSDPNNVVVFAFDPDNSGTKMQWLVIYPVQIGAVTGNKQNTQSVEFYWNQSSLSSPATDSSHYALNPSWLYGANGPSSSSGWTTNCGTAGSATCIQSDIEGASWYMEIALPLNGPMGDPSTGLILPPTGLFRMYFDVLRIVNGQWDQAPWPSAAPMAGCSGNTAGTCYPNTSIPANSMTGGPSGWGNGTIDPNPSPACNGVYIGSQNLDISVSNALPTSGTNVIDGMGPNTFNANVHNTGSAASNVGVTFFISNFGLPGSVSWQQVAQAPAGAFGTATIPSGGKTLSSNAWTPPDPSVYAAPNQHQCILATLSSNPPMSNQTYFVNTTAVQNMNFQNASIAEGPVEVSSKGYAVNPEHTTEQEFDIAVTTKESVLDVCRDKNVAASRSQPAGAQATTQNPSCTVSQLVETAEACRHTGMYLTARSNNKIELCQPVGSFTFVAKHQGTVANWNYTLTGPGLGQPDKNGLYHLRLANDSVVRLNNVIEANEISIQGCTHLFGFAAAPLFGGMILVGLVAYRKRRVPSVRTHGNSEPREKE